VKFDYEILTQGDVRDARAELPRPSPKKSA
jgi:hypothetical protein